MTTASATSHRTVYTGSSTNWPMVSVTIAAAVLLVVMATGGEGGTGAFAITAALLGLCVLAEVLTASSVRASAGPNGFDVRWGTVGWPRCTYALDEITRAEVIDLPWYRVTWGFWWTPRGTSCTVRSGPTVRLTLTSGRIVTVTVPDPALAVRALEDARTI